MYLDIEQIEHLEELADRLEAANDAMSDYLFMIEDEKDSDEYNH